MHTRSFPTMVTASDHLSYFIHLVLQQVVETLHLELRPAPQPLPGALLLEQEWPHSGSGQTRVPWRNHRDEDGDQAAQRLLESLSYLKPFVRNWIVSLQIHILKPWPLTCCV